jgi:hypothetical protein
MRTPCLSLMLLLAGCAATPEAAGTRELSGSWRNAEGATLEIEDTGVMMLQRTGPKQRPVIGSYTLQVEPNAFTASVVRDPCQDRQKILVGTWTRVGAARVTPES